MATEKMFRDILSIKEEYKAALPELRKLGDMERKKILNNYAKLKVHVMDDYDDMEKGYECDESVDMVLDGDGSMDMDMDDEMSADGNDSDDERSGSESVDTNDGNDSDDERSGSDSVDTNDEASDSESLDTAGREVEIDLKGEETSDSESGKTEGEKTQEKDGEEKSEKGGGEDLRKG